MSEHRLINVAIVGCGDHAREIILPTLMITPGVRIRGLCDDSEERIAMARRMCPEANIYTSIESICSDRSIDAVFAVATPQVHTRAARLAIGARKHIFVEKPFAADAATALELSRLAEQSDCVTMIGHNFRFAPALQRVKAVMEDSSFGLAALVEIRYLASKPRGDRWGLNSPTRSFLLSHGTHALDIAIDLLGKNVNVEHVALRQLADGLFASITLVTPAGNICALNITNAAPHFDIGASVVGSNGTMVTMQSLREVRNFGDSDHFKRIGHIWVPPVISSGFVQAGYAGEIAAFMEAIRRAEPTSPSFSDAAIVSELIEQVLNKSVLV